MNLPIPLHPVIVHTPIALILFSLLFDLVGRFSTVREHRYAVPAHLHEATRDGEARLLLPAPEQQLAVIQRGHQRRVPGEDGQLAFAPGRDEHVDTLLHAHDPLRGDDLHR